MRYYEFEIDTQNRIIKEKMWGFWNKRIADDYKKDFEIAVHPLVKNKWSKIADINEFRASNDNVLDIMNKHLQWARENNMEYNINVLGNLFDRLQLKSKLAEMKSSGFNKVVGTEEEAFKWLQEQGFKQAK